MKTTTMTTVETTTIQRNKDIKPFYTSRELAGLLNVSDQTILNYHAKSYMGFPRGIKVGLQWRWNPKDIDAWIEHYNENRAIFEQEHKNAKKSAQKDTPDIFIGIGKINHDTKGMEQEKKEKPARIEDFAQEMFDLLSRIAQSCKGNSKQKKEVSEIDEFMSRIMGL